MMLVLTYKVNALNGNMFDLAHLVLEQAQALGRRVAILVHVGKGVHLLAKSSSPLTSQRQGKQLLTIPPTDNPREQREQVLKQVSTGIQQLDEDPEFGPRVPIIVIGYAMVGRCASVRSKDRVITHIIAAYRNGRTSAAVHQMLMRGAGRSRQVGPGQAGLLRLLLWAASDPAALPSMLHSGHAEQPGTSVALHHHTGFHLHQPAHAAEPRLTELRAQY